MKIGNNDIKLYLGSAEIEKIYLGTSEVYEEEEPTPPHDYSQDYLTFVAEADNMSIGLTDAGNNVYQYSIDSGTTWSDLANNASTTSVNTGEKILFKASGLTADIGVGIGTLKPSVSASVQGNVMSLVYGDNFVNQETMDNFQFLSLFSFNATLISAKNLILPATALTSACYSNMFQGCTSLTVAPELPATTLAQSCYYNMFYSCTSLTTAPELPATTLANNCYQSMFASCRNLATAPELPATTLTDNCYDSMFMNCWNLNYIKCLATNISATDCTYAWVKEVAYSGTFVKAASMTGWTTGNDGIPNGWTIQNDDGSPYINDNWDDQE